MDYDVFLYILVELIVMILTSPRSLKMESECKRYARFRFALSAVFSGAEVPALRPQIPPREVPAQAPEVSAHIFFRGFLLSLFDVSLWRGSGNSGPQYGISGPGKIWLNLLSFSLGWGSGTFPESLLRKFPGHRKFRPLTPEYSATRGCNGQILGEAINSLLLPQEEAAHSFPISSIV